MLSFKQFLVEKWGRERREYSHLVHSGTVGNHKVEVHYMHDGYGFHRRNGGRWGVNFKVNDSAEDGGVLHPAHQRQVLDFVHKSIHGFVKKKQPHVIAMVANSPTKNSLYGRFADSIARKHGGKAYADEGSHEVVFNRKK
jgi:hypothetical protein